MLKLVVCIIILTAVCCAQEHFTCFKTNDVLNQTSPQTPQRTLQGSAGKQSSRGQVGSPGSSGQKREPGNSDVRQINLLRDQYNSLAREMEALRNQSRKNQHFLDVFTQRLYFPPHFYIYQLTPSRQSWLKSQEFCQNWGGNLAVYGVKTLANRKKLIRNLPITNYFWIGLNERIANEQNWIWSNGEVARNSDLNWHREFPKNSNNFDCVGLYFQPSLAGLAWDDLCTSQYLGLCEKEI